MNGVAKVVGVVAILIVGVACGGSTDDSATPPAESAAETVGVVDPSTSVAVVTGSLDLAGCEKESKGSSTFVDWDGDGMGECVGTLTPNELVDSSGDDLGRLARLTATPGSVEITVAPALLGRPTESQPGLVDLAVVGAQLGLWSAVDALQMETSNDNYQTVDGACASAPYQDVLRIVCSAPQSTAQSLVAAVNL